MEEAVLILFDDWFQRNVSSCRNLNLTSCNQKVERKWSLAAQLSSSLTPFHPWPDMQKSPVVPHSSASSKMREKEITSNLHMDRNPSPRLNTR